MAKKSDNIGCGSIVIIAFIIGFIFAGVQSCTHNLFGGGDSQPKTHKVQKKHHKKKNLNISLYNAYYRVKEEVPIKASSKNKMPGFNVTITKAYQLPLKDEEGFNLTKTGSAKYMTRRLYRIWIKAQVSAKYNARLGNPTLVANGKTYKTYADNDEFGTEILSGPYANMEMLFGIGSDRPKESKITLNVPVYATHKGNTVKTFNSSTTFKVK